MNSTEANNQALNSFIKQCKKPSHVLINGDFNHPEINWEHMLSTKNEDHKSSKFIEAVMDSFLFQHVDQPTHYRSDQQPTLIDLILTADEAMISNVQYLHPLGMSHHCGLLYEFNCYTKLMQNQSFSRPVFKYYAGRYDQMRKYIEDVKLANLIEGKSAKESWTVLDNALTEATKKFVPYKIINTNQKPPPPWMTERVKLKSREKWEAFRARNRTNNAATRRKYAKIRNQTKWEVRKAVRVYEKRIADESKTNPKGFYKYVKSKTKVKHGIPDLVEEDEIATDDHQKANMLNGFYSSVFTKEDTGQIPTPDNVFPGAKLSNIEITESKVMKILKKINQGKSPGADKHHPRVIRELQEQLVKPLTTLFQKCIDEGYLPAIWKEARITPIYKNKGAKSSPNNYRPVSLTSIICKILETIVKDEVLDHLKKNNLLYKYQHAFIGKRSCTTQILEALDNWTKLLENDQTVDTIYLDFSKAFDSVPHQRLLKKCKALGIEDKVLSWITAFLTNRRQCVNVNGTTSDWADVESGVPQGSVIGPILFVIFINDMPNKIQNFISLFADDAKLYGKSSSPSDRKSMQEDLNKLQQWSDTWQLRFNADKCNTLYLGKNNVKQSYSMGSNSGGQTLQETECEKDLGILVDNTLSFDKHICEAIKKANKKLAMIRRTFVYLDKKMLVQLYTSLVRPILEYGNVIWSPHLQSHIKQLEGVQHRATKMLSCLADMPYEQRLEELKLPSLAYRRMRGDVIEMFKYCQGEYSVHKKPFNLYSEVQSHSITRDHGFKVKKEKNNSAIRSRFFGNRIANIWNALPADIVNASSLNSFKNKIDEHWKRYLYIEDIRTIVHRTNSNASINC